MLPPGGQSAIKVVASLPTHMHRLARELATCTASEVRARRFFGCPVIQWVESCVPISTACHQRAARCDYPQREATSSADFPEFTISMRVALPAGPLLLVALLACPLLVRSQAPSPTMPVSNSSTSKALSMTKVATGEFTVKLLPLGAEGQPDDPMYGRMSINKSITGGLVASTVGQMLTAGTAEKGSAAYVAIEKVEGVLDGKMGSFALMHTGVMNRGTPSLSVRVVPDSGAGELVGIAGEFKIIIAGGKHAYEFHYTLP
ncbi:MAG: DUF3224 domain-containing protein [Burkholderiales bacterium]|nr:DUF3224 domain-containing protein [Burkholderiales bacterium]